MKITANPFKGRCKLVSDFNWSLLPILFTMCSLNLGHSQIIENRYYQLITDVDGMKRLDIQWGNSDPGTNVWIWDPNSTDAQLWRFVKTEDNDDLYYIISKVGDGNRYLTATEETGRQSNVYIDNKAKRVRRCRICVRRRWNINPDRQKWVITPNNEGSFFIRNNFTGQYLDVRYANNQRGTNAWQWRFNGSNAQRWFICLQGDNNCGRNRTCDRRRTIPINSVLPIASSIFDQVSVRLDNFDATGRSGRHFHQANNSWIQVHGQPRLWFDIEPESKRVIFRRWYYYVNDMNSTRAAFAFEHGNFILSLSFEGEGREIKGMCPSCIPRFRDSRAPDVDWQTPRRAILILEPMPFNGSISFTVENVIIEGGTTINSFLNPLLGRMRNKIRGDLRDAFQEELNKPEVANLIADIIRPILGNLNVCSVRIQGSNLVIN